MFPIALASFFLKAYSDDTDYWLDPFLGSGTTMIAAEQLFRRCFGMEICPNYVDVSIRRWQKLTGKEPVSEASGKGFAEVAAERGVEIEG